ncbi:hypothetical protein YDYSY3_48040 [Paenibacillus chitinolyticus]|uniref:hypothetical protein n=1 Tax=Paenibacillus chitinolyticus TaxID=79263 RepID=UPI0026E4A252|nr:hypothetical protein [Paenibacillus chitinolyticus]GKS13804.1 hypothetical protein YDYSY3_48040 [Paenibacillus chitinolyticus]
MAFTTGMLINTKDFGTASANAAVTINNEDAVNTAQIAVEIFYTLSTGVAKTPLFFQTYTVPPKFVDIRTFFISGVLAYEVQISVIAPQPNLVVASVFGLDTFNNIVPAHRVLQSELTPIPSLG